MTVKGYIFDLLSGADMRNNGGVVWEPQIEYPRPQETPPMHESAVAHTASDLIARHKRMVSEREQLTAEITKKMEWHRQLGVAIHAVDRALTVLHADASQQALESIDGVTDRELPQGEGSDFIDMSTGAPK